MSNRILVVAFTLLAPSLLLADDEKEGEPKAPKTFTVELLDADGKPVEGADIGMLAGMGDYYRKHPPKDGAEWAYNQHVRSDAGGFAQMTDDDDLKFLCIVARHERRKISAIASVDPAKLDTPIKLELLPECEVECHVKSPELAALHREIHGVVVYVTIGTKRALECRFESADFSIPLPPGTYGVGAKSSSTHEVIKAIVVNDHDRSQTIPNFELPATKLALLEGQPAPELPGIVAWKNSEPRALADLRGKVVILDFWGYWCSACVIGMPELFKLHDKYHGQGLEIIGVHVDLGEGETERVDTAAKLDERLKETRKNLWNGRDVPFPVALVNGERTAYRQGIEKQARSTAASEYGVIGYPTQILIDRQGKVIGPLLPTEEGIKLLEKAMSEK